MDKHGDAASPNRLLRISCQVRERRRLFSYTDPKSSLSRLIRHHRTWEIERALNADFNTRVYFHGTNLRFRGPPSACINSDTDFPEGYSCHFIQPKSFFFLFLFSLIWFPMWLHGWWVNGFFVRVRERTMDSRGTLAPSKNDRWSIPRLTLAYGTPLNILWHPGATSRALCVRSCPMNLKYDRIPSPKSTEGADFPDLSLKFHSLSEDFLRNIVIDTTFDAGKVWM